MNRKDICKNIIQSIYEYITSPDKLEPHREKILRGSDPTVVNLSPEALIYQGFLALFLYKKMKYFIKIT